jgi:hypothetical protein
MKAIQSKCLFEEKVGPDTELTYVDVIFKYNPENVKVNDMSQLYEKQQLIAVIRSYESYGTLSYYFVEDSNVDDVFKVLKNLADVNTKSPNLTFDLSVLDEYDISSIITNPSNFSVDIYNPKRLLGE